MAEENYFEEGRGIFEDAVDLEEKKATQYHSEEICSSLEIILDPPHKNPGLYPFTDLLDVGRCSF
jgi:hypothetical protein